MEDQPRIVVDSREPDTMAALLVGMGMKVEKRTITPGDYIVAEGWAVERKTVNDFINSLFQGRLLEQLRRLKETYPKPVLLLEGNIALGLEGRRNPRSFWGALMMIELELCIPVLVTMNLRQSADALYTLAKRLQKKSESRFSLRHKPKMLSDRERQIFTVEGFPNVGDELAVRLLKKFKTVRKVSQASKIELEKVEGIGSRKASRIIQLLDMPFIETEKE